MLCMGCLCRGDSVMFSGPLDFSFAVPGVGKGRGSGAVVAGVPCTVLGVYLVDSVLRGCRRFLMRVLKSSVLFHAFTPLLGAV